MHISSSSPSHYGGSPNNNNNNNTRHADAEAVIRAAASVTLSEFVRCLADVAKIYLGASCAGTAPEFSLKLLLRWKVTPLVPLMPLLATSLLLRTPFKEPSSFDEKERHQQQQQARGAGGDDDNATPLSPSGEQRRSLQREDRRAMADDPRFANAWNKLVGTAVGQKAPTIGDVSAFLLAHFPDVIAAARGWDCSARAGFSGSEIFSVRCVLFAVMVAGMRRCPSRLKAEAQSYDFVRELGNYKKRGGGGDDTSSSSAAMQLDYALDDDASSTTPAGSNNNNNNNNAQQQQSPPATMMEVEIKAVPVQDLLDFVSGRSCPWHAVAEAWPDCGSEADPRADQHFRDTIEECGLAPEVLQAFPAWETISAVVKRAENSINNESKASTRFMTSG